METKTASTRMSSFLVLYDMHTDFFGRALVDLSDEDAHNRLNTKANHVAWLAGSLIHERYQLAKELGIDQKDAADELFKDNKGIGDGITYPTLDEYKKDWEKISPLLKDALANADDARLDQPFEMPGMQMTLYDYISFMIYREANCIGQIALWRRLLGHKALNYM